MPGEEPSTASQADIDGSSPAPLAIPNNIGHLELRSRRRPSAILDLLQGPAVPSEWRIPHTRQFMERFLPFQLVGRVVVAFDLLHRELGQRTTACHLGNATRIRVLASQSGVSYGGAQ
jgi:hypothetical protein